MKLKVNKMELAKITSKGQITLPISIRRKLNLQDGGKVAFIGQSGTYTLINPLRLAIENVQKRLRGKRKGLA